MRVQVPCRGHDGFRCAKRRERCHESSGQREATQARDVIAEGDALRNLVGLRERTQSESAWPD